MRVRSEHRNQTKCPTPSTTPRERWQTPPLLPSRGQEAESGDGSRRPQDRVGGRPLGTTSRHGSPRPSPFGILRGRPAGRQSPRGAPSSAVSCGPASIGHRWRGAGARVAGPGRTRTARPFVAHVGPRARPGHRVRPSWATSSHARPGAAVWPEPRRWILQDRAGSSQDPFRASERARPCHVVPGRATKPRSSTAARASRDEPQLAGPTSRSDPCQVVPRRARTCPRVTRPIAHSVAHSPPPKLRSRPNGRFSREFGGVCVGSCRTRTCNQPGMSQLL